MDLNEAINLNYTKWMDKVRKVVPADEAGDVLHTVLLSMLERDQAEKLSPEEIDCLDCYVVSSCKMAYRSPNSPYSRQLDRHLQRVDFDEAVHAGEVDEEEPDEGDRMEGLDIIAIVNESPFSWYEKELFKRRLLEDGGKTLKRMAEECNLSPSQVWYTHRKIKQYIKQKIDNEQQEKQKGTY